MTMTPHPPYGSNPYGWNDSPPPPPPAPPVEPPAPAPGRGSSFRRRTAVLFVAATLAAGATGAGVTLLVDDQSPATSSAVPTIQRSATGSNASATVAGTTESAAAIIGPSVVTINVTGSESVTGQFGRSSTQQVSGTGSGVVLDKTGYIVTNNHVISAAVGNSGGTVTVTFSDGSTVPATIVGHDATSDLAVIRVAASDKLVPATFADSDALKVGQDVLAVGAPLGLSNTVTDGIVSTLHRPVRTGESGASQQSVIDAVQTDAAINPGNSGGALVNLAGEVVGINSAIATTGSSSSGTQSGNIGVGFAIASNDVTEVAQELIKTGVAQHPQLGINVGDTDDNSGATVQGTSQGGPAASAGLTTGDVITKVDDRLVTGADSLIVAVRAHDPGDTVTVTYLRDGQTHTAKATLVAAPAE